MRFLFVMASHLLWILTFVCIDITMMNDDFFLHFSFRTTECLFHVYIEMECLQPHPLLSATKDLFPFLQNCL